MHFVVLCPKAPEDSTGSGSGFKHLRRRDHATDWWSRIELWTLGYIAKKGHNHVTKTDIRVQK